MLIGKSSHFAKQFTWPTAFLENNSNHLTSKTSNCKGTVFFNAESKNDHWLVVEPSIWKICTSQIGNHLPQFFGDETSKIFQNTNQIMSNDLAYDQVFKSPRSNTLNFRFSKQSTVPGAWIIFHSSDASLPKNLVMVVSPPDEQPKQWW